MKREELLRYNGEWYDANIVDCLLDEKDAEIEDLLRQNRELCQALQVMYSKEEYGKLQTEIESLKAKLENVQASAYVDSVDAGMRERRLNRALWLARAYRAEARKNYWYARSCHEGDKYLWSIDGSAVKYIGCIKRTNFDWLKVWQNVERKCLKKAEEYR